MTREEMMMDEMLEAMAQKWEDLLEWEERGYVVE
jgi:hypothetical protein